MPGLGGGFEYVELGEPLFTASGSITPSVGFFEMASYVYFTETHTHLEKKRVKGSYIGDYSGTSYFLLFKQVGKNTLSKSTLAELRARRGEKVVYADKCLLSDDMLAKHQITFKQIPYSVKVY